MVRCSGSWSGGLFHAFPACALYPAVCRRFLSMDVLRWCRSRSGAPLTDNAARRVVCHVTSVRAHAGWHYMGAGLNATCRVACENAPLVKTELQEPAL